MLPYLKTNPDMRDVPVFVVTNVDDRQKAMSLGADAFAQKPLERRWLLDHLYKLTGRNAPHKILVIDDEEVSRYLVRQLFPSPPDVVIEASNGVEGLRFARDEQRFGVRGLYQRTLRCDDAIPRCAAKRQPLVHPASETAAWGSKGNAGFGRSRVRGAIFGG